MPPPLFVSFFTAGTGYAEEAAALVATLDSFGLPHDVRPVPNAGRWEHNCNRKASYLREMRAEHPGRPLVWLDADARVRQRPDLFDALGPSGCGFAAHWKDGAELLSGTLYFGAAPAAGELIRRWETECKFFPDQWDQVTLSVVLSGTPELNVARLPAPYCLIFDLMADQGPPVIEHTQASRRLKRRV